MNLSLIILLLIILLLIISLLLILMFKVILLNINTIILNIMINIMLDLSLFGLLFGCCSLYYSLAKLTNIINNSPYDGRPPQSQCFYIKFAILLVFPLCALGALQKSSRSIFSYTSVYSSLSIPLGSLHGVLQSSCEKNMELTFICCCLFKTLGSEGSMANLL